ncbi:MAG: diguanylate cyclase [Holophagaceae bacterium]
MDSSGSPPPPRDDAPSAARELAARTRLAAILRRMDLTWPDLTRPQADRVVDLLLDLDGLALAAEEHGRTALVLAARDLHRWLRKRWDQGTPLRDDEQLEIVDALVRMRFEVGPELRAPAISPMPRVCILAPHGGVDIQAGQAAPAGYLIETFEDLTAFQAAVEADPPDLVVLDLEASARGEDPGALVAGSPAAGVHPVPLAFLSQYADLEARLEAVRAGGVAFFPKPLDLAALLDTLDQLQAHQLQEPLRVLVVEDDPLTAAFCTRILEGAGMRTAVVRDPMAVMEPLVEHRPDVLLMDVYMPGCSGLELASVIRQQSAYVSLPIVYLSAEQHLGRQLEALARGAEDFLTKPVSPVHLISIVTTRALRGRQLRNLLVRDSLTGLLNHVHLKDKLRLEVARAARVGSPLAFAMLDLDGFKAVNDTHGHASGDRVLKNLARLLQHRLRRTDVSGRWGGEEFAVILPDTSLPVALQVMEEVRTRFAGMPQEVGRETVHVTLSCGIAAYPEFHDPLGLVDAADQALYAAKRLGRDRCVTSTPCEPPLTGDLTGL